MTVKAPKLEFYVGNKQLLRNTILDKDADPEEPLDLTGMTVKWALSKVNGKTYAKEAVLNKTATITSAVDGECEVLLLKADTEDIPPGTYHQEWEVYDGSNETAVVTVGDVVLLLNVDNP